VGLLSHGWKKPSVLLETSFVSGGEHLAYGEGIAAAVRRHYGGLWRAIHDEKCT
jgi:hypothetical protein